MSDDDDQHDDDDDDLSEIEAEREERDEERWAELDMLNAIGMLDVDDRDEYQRLSEDFDK